MAKTYGNLDGSRVRFFFVVVFFFLHRYCSEGKRTFSSRLILEKHIRVRHGIRTRQTIEKRVKKYISGSLKCNYIMHSFYNSGLVQELNLNLSSVQMGIGKTLNIQDTVGNLCSNALPLL